MKLQKSGPHFYEVNAISVSKTIFLILHSVYNAEFNLSIKIRIE